MTVVALGNVAAGYFFFTDNRKLHTALRASVVSDGAKDRENSFAALGFVPCKHFLVYVDLPTLDISPKWKLTEHDILHLLPFPLVFSGLPVL